jgi:signal transduction histidine kinase
VPPAGREPGGRDGHEESWLSLPERVDAVVARTPLGGPAVIAAVGAGLFLVSVLVFFRNLQEIGFSLVQVAALVFGTWLSAIVVYAALHIAGSDFTPRQRWQIAASTVVGFLFVTLVVYLAVFVRTSSGLEMSRPTLPLLASAESGAIAGFLIGLFYVRARADAREARRVGNQLEFMHSILRHDVLNSMTVVRARAEHLDAHLDDGQQESVEAILNQAESVIDLSQRARAMVTAVAEEADVDSEPVDLSRVLRDEIATVQASYDDLQVSASVPENVYVFADEMLAEVFGNLLENAVRHNDKDRPRLRVDVSVASDDVVVRIADNGPGIDDDRKERVFERGESSSGGGFGLFFVKTMIDHYGGDVRIEDRADRRAVPSQTDGGDREGSVFVVELARAEQPAIESIVDFEFG